MEEENDEEIELTVEMKSVLDERLQEDRETYITADTSIDQLRKKLVNR